MLCFVDLGHRKQSEFTSKGSVYILHTGLDLRSQTFLNDQSKTLKNPISHSAIGSLICRLDQAKQSSGWVASKKMVLIEAQVENEQKQEAFEN